MSSALFLSAMLASLLVAWFSWEPLVAAVCVGMSSILGCMAYHRWRRETEFLPPAGKAVLITGCDSGLGHATAKHLDALGVQVFAGCLFPDGEGASKLSADCSDKLRVVPLDVTKQEDVDAAMETIKQHTGQTGLWGVINNAGILLMSELEVTPIETIQRHLDVNLLGIIRVVKGALPLLRKTRGRIVNVTSINSYFYMPLFGAYSISKAAAEMFSNVLRMESRKWRVKVATIHPSGFKTSLFASRDNVSRYHQKCYDQLTAEQKQYYTPEYFEKTTLKTAGSSYVSADFSPVTSAVSRALLEREPSTSYHCGKMAGTFLRAAQWLPTPLFDFLVYNSQLLNVEYGLIPDVPEQN